MANIPASEHPVTVELVRALLADQSPALADLPLAHVDGGWDNELFRLGDSMLVRLPRREVAAELMEHELRWVPVICASLPVETPLPIFAGRPGKAFPWPWSVVPWIEGTRAGNLPLADRTGAAETLADVFHLLHVTAPHDAPLNPFRGGSLNRPEADQRFRDRVADAGDAVDPDAVLARWEFWRTASDWDGNDVWLHGDLHPLNLVIDGSGDLAGVIDWGDLTSGDPACDLATAWLTFDPEGRALFVARANLGGAYDEPTWTRARAWGLHLAVMMLTQSDDRPAMRRIGEQALAQLMAEPVA